MIILTKIINKLLFFVIQLAGNPETINILHISINDMEINDLIVILLGSSVT